MTVELNSATVKSTEETVATKLQERQDSADITNLTAEIESFVRIADTDKEMLEAKTNDSNETVENGSPEHKDYYPKDSHTEEITMERIQSLGEMDENSDNRCKTSPIKILVRAPTDENDIDEELETITEVEVNEGAENEITKPVDEKLNTQSVEEKSVNTNTDSPQVEVETDIKPVEELKIEDENEIIPSTLIEEFIAENDANKELNELKITESLDDLTTVSYEPKQVVCETKEEFFQREDEPCSSRSTISSLPFRFNNNDGKKVPPPPPPRSPQRRRSVREIIESINKCQSLLKVNQDQKITKMNNNDLFQTPTSSSSSPSKTFQNKSFFVDRNMNDSNNKDYENKRLFTDMAELNNNSQADEAPNIPLFVEKFNELNNNNSNVVFEKCVVKDVGSRWNPVPKPRRHRKMSNEL